MTDIITFLDNNRKLAIYKGENIHGIYFYLEIIGSPTNLNYLGKRSDNFVTSSSTNKIIYSRLLKLSNIDR